jgi:hypothetical protein
MKKKYVFIIFVVIIVIITVSVYLLSLNRKVCWPDCGEMTDQDREILRMQDQIVLLSPKSGDTISSPVTIKGEARGTWYFEASFPIVIVNWDGLIIGEGIAQAQSDWMTEDFVPFEAVVNFETPSYSDRGAIILKNDNPSGDPARDKAIEVPIRFSYYNKSN